MKSRFRVIIIELFLLFFYFLQVRYFFRVLEALPFVNPSSLWLPVGILFPSLILFLENVLIGTYYSFIINIVSQVKILGKIYTFTRPSLGSFSNLMIMFFNTVLFAIPYYILRN